MKEKTSQREILVPARTGAAVPVRRGQTLRIINVEGGQICDFICFNLQNFKEKLSTGETVNFNTIIGDKGSIYLTVGKRIYSNAQNPMFEITEDMSKGVHDLLYAPCSSALYAASVGDPMHSNCRDNLTKAVAAYGIHYLEVPDPINLFQSTRPRPDGTINFALPVIKAGEYVAMKALVDNLVAVSACPFDEVMDGVSINTCTALKLQFAS